MSLDNDAREFGQHFRQGGWRLGLLVARNVEPGKPGRPSGEIRSPENDSGKVSMSEFAEMAGVSKSHVSYYYHGWQLAADDGECPPAESLSPDDEILDNIEEDDEQRRELWLTYYRKARDGNLSDGQDDEPAKEQSRPISHHGTCGRKQTTPGTKVGQAVEALSKTSEQLSKKLVQVMTSAPLRGDDAELAAFAEELRRTRSELDKYCQEIDLVLERIGYGDAED